jgi:hypothetical protein
MRNEAGEHIDSACGHKIQAVRRLVVSVFLVGLAGLGSAHAQLFGPEGVKPQVVRQGLIGSCYFHAAVAAVALTNPAVLRNMIRENANHSYTVRFLDQKMENAYPEDLEFARKSGYERSDGLWVVVLLRAYAQRVLREALLSTIDNSDLSAVLKIYLKGLVASDDSVLLAYDRAIRTVVDQQGNIDRVELVQRLKREMQPFNISSQVGDSLIQLLDSGGLLESLAAVIRQNGELFGAYRAIGQGGLPERVLGVLMGKQTRHFQSKSEQQEIIAALNRAASQPVVATTGGAIDESVSTDRLTPEDQKWYVKAHAFTVLGYDPAKQLVALRNPWASSPDPDGIFTIPLAKFLAMFPSIVTTAGGIER